METAPQPVHGRERRRAPRHAVNTPAYASLNGSSQTAPVELCEILNISESGSCIQAPAQMKVNRLLPLVLDLSETHARVHTTGHVVWSEGTGRAGIRFPELPENSLQQLQQWLAINGAADASNSSDTLVGATPKSSPTLRSKQGLAAGYTSLIIEWAEIERDVELFGANLEGILQLIVERALALTWATGAAIALHSDISSPDLVCEARAGNHSPELGTRVDADSGFSGECIRAGNALKCDDADGDARVDSESCRALGIRSLIACPIKTHKKQILGILEVFSPEPAAFWDNDIRTLERLARIAGDAIAQVNHENGKFLPIASLNAEEKQSSNNARVSETTQVIEEQTTTLSPQARSIVLFVTGIVAVVSAVWITAPWISDAMNGSLVRPVSQAAEIKPASADYSMDLAQLKKFAADGSPSAQYSLGMRYAAGDGLAQDYHQALNWFLKSADTGYLRAAPKIASCFWAGRGTQQDYSKAYFWGLLAQASGDETGHVIVINSAPHLSDHQRSAEQQEADAWLRSHHLTSVRATR